MNIHLNAVHAQSTLRVAQLLGIGCRAHEDRMVLEFPKRERRLETGSWRLRPPVASLNQDQLRFPMAGLHRSQAPHLRLPKVDRKSIVRLKDEFDGTHRVHHLRRSASRVDRLRPLASRGFIESPRGLIPLHASMPLGASGQGRAYRVWASRSNGGRSWMATRCRELPGMQRAHGAASRGKEATAPFESAPAWTSHGRATAARKAGEGVRANCVASAELAIRSRKRQRADAIAERRANSGAVRSGAALGALMLSALESQGATHQFEVRIFGKGLDRKAQPLHELQHVGVVAQHQPINLREALVAGHIDDRLQQA